MHDEAALMAQQEDPNPVARPGLSGVQKASLLLMALGADSASAVMQCLQPDDIKALGSQIAQLKTVDPKIREIVFEEFTRRHSEGSSVSGADYAKQILEQVLGASKAKDVVAEIASDQRDTPFGWLKSVDPQKLASCLHNERPEVTALVLAHLAPSRAADIIAELPEHIQGDLAHRLSNMQSVSPEVAKTVEDVMSSKLSRKVTMDFRAIGGINSLVAILNNADRSTENGNSGLSRKNRGEHRAERKGDALRLR